MLAYTDIGNFNIFTRDILLYKFTFTDILRYGLVIHFVGK